MEFLLFIILYVWFWFVFYFKVTPNHSLNIKFVFAVIIYRSSSMSCHKIDLVMTTLKE